MSYETFLVTRAGPVATQENFITASEETNTRLEIPAHRSDQRSNPCGRKTNGASVSTAYTRNKVTTSVKRVSERGNPQ